MRRRRFDTPSPELIVMGLLAAVCGLALAALLSALFGAHSAGPPASLRTVAAPAPDLGKLRRTAVRSEPARKRVTHPRRARRARRHHRHVHKAAPSPAPTVAAVEAPTTTTQGTTGASYPTGYTTPQPAQQISTPTYSPPAKKPVTRHKRSSSTGGSFDDSG
jgi:hypothetical protein